MMATDLRTMELRSVLMADAAVCLAFGLVCLSLADPLAPFLTHRPDRVGPIELAPGLRLLGGAVMLIGIGVAGVARMHRIRFAAVAPILAIEIIWIAVSGAILLRASHHLTAWGVAVVVASAAAVGAFLILEVRGLRTLQTRTVPSLRARAGET